MLVAQRALAVPLLVLPVDGGVPGEAAGLHVGAVAAGAGAGAVWQSKIYILKRLKKDNSERVRKGALQQHQEQKPP